MALLDVYRDFRCRRAFWVFRRWLDSWPDDDIGSIFHEAIRQSDVPTLRYLIRRKCPLPTASLDLAVSDKVVEFLLEAGADPNQVSSNGKPVIFGKQVNTLRMLLEYGADANVKFRGSTPLHRVIEERCEPTETVDLLLRWGADPSICNLDGYNALQTAIHSQNVAAYERLSPSWQDAKLMGALIPIRYGRNARELTEALWKCNVDDDTYKETCLETAYQILGEAHPSCKRLRVQMEDHWFDRLCLTFKEYDILSSEVAEAVRQCWNLGHDTFSGIERHHQLFHVLLPPLLEVTRRTLPESSSVDAHDKLVKLVFYLMTVWDIPELYWHDLAGLTLKRCGSTFLHYTCTTDTNHWLISIPLIPLVKKKNINARNAKGETPLLVAIKHRVNYQKVLDLLHNGADPHLETNEGLDAVQMAIRSKHVTVFRHLSRIASPRDKELMSALFPIGSYFSPLAVNFLGEEFQFDKNEDYWTYCLQTAERLLSADHPTFRELRARIGHHYLQRHEWSKGFALLTQDEMKEALFYIHHQPVDSQRDILRALLPALTSTRDKTYDTILTFVYNTLLTCSPGEDLVRDSLDLVFAENGDTFLHRLLAEEDNDALIEQFQLTGTNVNATNSTDNTPLHVAVRQRSRHVALLLQYGADASLRNQDGEDALMTALFSRNVDAFELFSPRAADTELMGAMLHSRELSTKLNFDTDSEFFDHCVAVARRRLGEDHPRYRELVVRIGLETRNLSFLIRNLSVVDNAVYMVLRNESDKTTFQTILPPLRETPDWIGKRPPNDPVFGLYDRILTTVLDKLRCDYDRPEDFLPDLLDLQFLESGDSIVHYAVRYRWMIEELLKAGANPDVRNFVGNTPLHLANDTNTIKLLVDYGAHPDKVNERGERPPCEKRLLNLQCLAACIFRPLLVRYCHIPQSIKQFVYMH